MQDPEYMKVQYKHFPDNTHRRYNLDKLVTDREEPAIIIADLLRMKAELKENKS